MQNKILYIAAFLLTQICLYVNPVDAHMGEHDSIILLNQKIKNDEKNASLYLERGRQHMLAGHVEPAMLDFSTAESLDPDNDFADFYRAELFLENGWYVSSEYYLKKFIENNPEDTTALIYLGRALSYRNKGNEATLVYNRVLKLIPNPTPEFYNEMADSYLAEGNYSGAIGILDMGIGKLGYNTFLQNKALNIELGRGMSREALSRVDKLIKYSPQKEKWLYTKGRILESMDRKNEARNSYKSALELLSSRPYNKQEIKALVELKKEISESLDRLSQK